VYLPRAVGGALEKPPRLKVCRAFEIIFAARPSPGVPAAAAAWASHRGSLSPPDFFWVVSFLIQPPLATPRVASRPLLCRIPVSILLLLFMQGSLARPDFDRLRAGSEFLRRRAPVSRLEPLRYKRTFIYFYTHVPHVSSCDD
jgi:hypothetical protein